MDRAVVNMQQGELLSHVRSDSVVVKSMIMLAKLIREGMKKNPLTNHTPVGDAKM